MIDNISFVVFYLFVDCLCINDVFDLILVVIEIMFKCFCSDVMVVYWNV